MTNRKIYGWDLNIWNQNDGSIDGVEDQWTITAYPFDVNEDIIGGHNVYLSFDLHDYEADLMHLGMDDNEYDNGSDTWMGCDWFIQEYPHQIPSRVIEWLESLPTESDSIDITLF
jgi:hypothetical protein